MASPAFAAVASRRWCFRLPSAGLEESGGVVCVSCAGGCGSRLPRMRFTGFFYFLFYFSTFSSRFSPPEPQHVFRRSSRTSPRRRIAVQRASFFEFITPNLATFHVQRVHASRDFPSPSSGKAFYRNFSRDAQLFRARRVVVLVPRVRDDYLGRPGG